MRTLTSNETMMILGSRKHFYALESVNDVETVVVEIAGFLVGASTPLYLYGAPLTTVSIPLLAVIFASGACGTVVMSAIHAWGVNQEKSS